MALRGAITATVSRSCRRMMDTPRTSTAMASWSMERGSSTSTCFTRGFARARDEDGWMHIDRRGRPAYARRFQAVEPFYNGQARVERFDGALEVIDEGGATLVEIRAPRSSEFASLSADMVGFWRTQTIGAAVTLGGHGSATGHTLGDRASMQSPS